MKAYYIYSTQLAISHAGHSWNWLIIPNCMFKPPVETKLIGQYGIVQTHWACSRVLRNITSRAEQKANRSNSFLDSGIALVLLLSRGGRVAYKEHYLRPWILSPLFREFWPRNVPYIQYPWFYYLASLHYIKDSGQMESYLWPSYWLQPHRYAAFISVLAL